MSGSQFRSLLPVGLALLAWPLLAPPAAVGCPAGPHPTLATQVDEASMVLFGTLTNAKRGAFGEQGTTDLLIEDVIKDHDVRAGREFITLPRYVPPDNDGPQFLIFFDVVQGQIDPYRGVCFKCKADIIKYLQGAMKLKDKPIGERLKFFFNYLDNPDPEIGNDAFAEFANAGYRDYREMARHLPAARIARWLQDPETPEYRYGLYASLLGHCGTAKDADLLCRMLDDPRRRAGFGVDGILAGYTLLKPKDGWAYLRGILNDRREDAFRLRYAALLAARFFWESRPDAVDKEAVVEGVCLLLDQNDMADLAIEDLRKWCRWEVVDRILHLYGQKSHDIPIVRRAILRYAMSCPGAKAKAFVDEIRKKDPDIVNDVEEVLKLETPPTAMIFL